MKAFKRFTLLFILLFFIGFSGKAQENREEQTKKMAWFQDAKLGIFIHWGIYSVGGIDESWSFFNGYISYDDYMKQMEGFTATNYNPKDWVKWIKKSGAKYAVITTKHHDGIALWDTKQSDLNVVQNTNAGRDLIAPFVKAMRDEGLHLGLYYSLLDWSHPDYSQFTRTTKRYENDSLRWEKFMSFNLAQLQEISRFNPDLYWFDGDWEHTAEEWKAIEIREMLLSNNPQAIINSRLQGYGDYATPEQGVPITKPKDKYWELCMTSNNSWGYQQLDKEYKSVNQIVRILADCISMGGNLLLGIGPKPDGTIPQEQLSILEGLGRWTTKHAEAIYGTRAGIPKEYFNGYTALSPDKNILYLFVDNQPNGPLVIKGLNNKVNRVWVVGNGTKLSYQIVGKQYWSPVPGLLYIDVPKEVQDAEVTVIAVLLDGEVDLFSDEVKAIESN